jgi:hypothetical protein
MEKHVRRWDYASIGQDNFGNVWNRPTDNRRRVCTAFPVYLRLIYGTCTILHILLDGVMKRMRGILGIQIYIFPWHIMGFLLHFHLMNEAENIPLCFVRCDLSIFVWLLASRSTGSCGVPDKGFIRLTRKKRRARILFDINLDANKTKKTSSTNNLLTRLQYLSIASLTTWQLQRSFVSSSCSKEPPNRHFLCYSKSKYRTSSPRERRLISSRFRTNAPSSRQGRSRLHPPKLHKLKLP